MGADRFVILGNGGAALFAARAARLAGHRGEIHLVSDTEGPAFNPMLSPYFFKGKLSWKDCFPFGAGFYSDYQIACHFGDPAVSLAASRQQVTLGSGKVLAYDRCLIATGTSPVVPPIPGLRESPRAFPLRSAASALKLEGAMQTARKAVVLGASLVGLEMAEILSKKGIRVVLLDVVDQVLPRGTHPAVAAMLRAYLEEQGVEVRLGCTMEGMEGAGEGVTCRFSGDVVEEADVVIVCTGVRSNLAFLDRNEVKVDLGVLTDERMRTGVDHLYAAGDASQAFNLVSGTQDWLGTWGSACYQGRTAGQNMAGHDSVFTGTLPENISPLFDWHYAQLGNIQPQGGETRHLAFGDPRKRGYGLLAFQDGVLVGANLINCTQVSGQIRNAVLRKWRFEQLSEIDDLDMGECSR
jgi:assimilatory nitrate reductase electron transfer subunit/3-phenylpropionate/trans-cinnamate dioxygenase ferredoxin reductase subunit